MFFKGSKQLYNIGVKYSSMLKFRGDYNEHVAQKSVALIFPSSKIGTYLYKIDADPQEDSIRILSAYDGSEGAVLS